MSLTSDKVQPLYSQTAPWRPNLAVNDIVEFKVTEVGEGQIDTNREERMNP